MDIKEIIATRRSVRRYKPDKISREDLQEIVEAALMAPSSVNYQPWYFVVLQDEAALAEATDIMKIATERLRPDLEERFSEHPEVVAATTRFISSLGSAPACVLAFQYKDTYPPQQFVPVTESVAAAIENLILMAWSKGIGSCWMTAANVSKVDKDLHDRFAPDKGELVAMITLGYPAETPKAPKRKEGRFVIE